MKTILTLILAITASMLYSQSISNINPVQRTDGTMIIDITYDLAGPASYYIITAEASFDDGVSFSPIDSLSGHIGPGTVPGAGKAIVWAFGNEFPGQYSNVTQIRLTAEEIPPVPMITNPITGRTWMDRNLGATQVATSSTDADAYGDLYQWGRLMDGHELRTSSTTSTLSSTDVPGHGNFITVGSSPFDWRISQNNYLWQPVNARPNDPCPFGFRLPTDDEWDEEINSWTSQDSAGAFASVLKLTVAGYRNRDNGALNQVGVAASYWSSSTTGVGENARLMNFGDGYAYTNSYHRGYGYSVRCIKDDVPNVTNPVTGKTWMDRNLGASQVATSVADVDAYGDYYQWGRLPDGHQDPASPISNIASTTDIPGHASYIIQPWTTPYNWRIPQNDNLWQGIDGTNNPCPFGYRIPTAMEWAQEIETWASEDAVGAFGSVLKLPAGGFRGGGNGSFGEVGINGRITASTVNGIFGSHMFFNGTKAFASTIARSNGLPVRCIKGEEPPPWTCGEDMLNFKDANIYPTVQIGAQCWMAKNLNTGNMINGSSTPTDNGSIEKYCYGDDEINCETYGAFYLWDEIMEYDTTEGDQGICPAGWHIPTNAEWCTLENYVDAGTIDCNTTGSRGIDGGGKLKEASTTHWNSPNTGATNSSGFTSLPSGYRDWSGVFLRLSEYADYWTSSEVASNSVYRQLVFDNAEIGRDDNAALDYGFSVRCLKD